VEKHFLVVFVSQKERQVPFFGALGERNMLIEWHFADSPAPENWAVTAKVEGSEKKERKLFHLEVKVI